MAQPAGQGGPQPNPRPILRRAPLVAAAVAMAGGVVAGRYVPLPAALWAVLGAAALATALGTVRREHLAAATTGGILAAIVMFSAFWVELCYNRLPPDHIVTYTDRAPVLATIRGRVVSSPQEELPQAAYWSPPKAGFLLEATAIRAADGQWLPTEGSVRVTVGPPILDAAAAAPRGAVAVRPLGASSQPSPPPSKQRLGVPPEAPPDILALPVGAEVELTGSIRRIGGPGNPGQYDWRESGRLQGLFVKCSVPVADGVRILPDANRSWPERAWLWAKLAARRHVLSAGDEEDATLVNALVLGERAPSLRTLNQAMMEAGTAHYLSISGSHLVIFLGFVYMLCRLLAVPPRRAAAAVLVVLLAYLLLAEPNPPLWRSGIMAGAICIAVIAGRASHAANALAVAGILLLALDPLQLFTAGFQLSFGLVMGMVALTRPIRSVAFSWFLRRRGLLVFRGAGRFRRWVWFRGADWAMNLASVALAAYVVSLPLVAYHFGLFSPYASVLSVLLAPVITAVLVPAYISLALAPLVPNLAGQIEAVAAWAAALLRQAVQACNVLPGLSTDVYTVPVWAVILFFVVVAAWVCCRQWRWGIAAAGAGTVALVVIAVLTQLPAAAPPAGRLHVLDVAQGSMTLLHVPSGKTYLFDAGTLGSPDLCQQVLRPFLRAQRLRWPEAVFLSHANLDHYNALVDVLDRGGLKTAYMNEHFGVSERSMGILPMSSTGVSPVSSGGTSKLAPKGRSLLGGGSATHDTPKPAFKGQTATAPLAGSLEGATEDQAGPAPGSSVRNLMAAFARHGVRIVRLKAGDVVDLGGGAKVAALWPEAADGGRKLSDNDASLVVRVCCGGRTALLPGDISEATQALLARLPVGAPGQPKADVLVLPHHGGATPSLAAFIVAVDPAVMVQSSTWRHDSPRLLEAFGGRKRYATFRDGWTAVDLDAGLAVQTMGRK